MLNKNVLWAIVGLLAVGLFASYRSKLKSPAADQYHPNSSQPFEDRWGPAAPPFVAPVAPPQPLIGPPQSVLGAPASYAEAVEIAAKTKKPLLVYFTGKSCVACQKMLANCAEVITGLAGKAVYYEVDVDKEPDLVRKFGVNLTPTYLMLNGQEKIMKRGVGYKNANDFTAWLALPYAAPVTPPPPPRAIHYMIPEN